jgi:hypothetical protein
MQVKSLVLWKGRLWKCVHQVAGGVKRNPGFSTFTSVCQVRNGDDVDPPEDIAPDKMHLLKYAPVTSCDAENSFSAYKYILSDKI